MKFTSLAELGAFVLKASITNSKEIKNFWRRINLIKRLSSLFINKQLQFLMIISTCFTLAVDIFYEFGPVYLTVKWKFVPSDLILYNGGLCIGLAIENGWLPNWVSQFTSNQPLIILSSIAGFTFLLIGMMQTNSMVLMLFLFSISGLFIGLAVTLITVKISNSVDDTIQGEVMGMQLSLRALGDGIICLLGGFLLLLSSKVILLFASLLATGTFVYYAKCK